MTETTGDRPADTASLPQLTDAEKLALLERIVASPQFRRAARLRDFLLFVGQNSIRNGSAPIHELEIGSAVFERAAGYDTGADNIVRVNATELRKRLEVYFSADGAAEPVVVEMPRGSYTLLFRTRSLSVETPEPPPPREPPAVVPALPLPMESEVPPTRRTAAVVLWPALSLLLLFAALVLFWQNAHLRERLTPWRHGAALQTFWSDFFESDQEVDLVLADTSFALAEDMEGRSIPLSSYLNYDYKHTESIPGLSADRREDLQRVLDRNNGSAGDYIVANRILGLDHDSSKLHLKFAREYLSETIKTNSVILIGSRQSNPWVELYDPRMNFTMDYDPALRQSSVHNRQPQRGEEAVYTPARGLAQNQGLSVIAFMPDLSRTGGALIIEGTDSQATRAAGEFVTSDASLQDFLSRIHSRTFPYFEILLENSQLTGTPLHSRIVAFRVYPRNSAGAEGAP